MLRFVPDSTIPRQPDGEPVSRAGRPLIVTLRDDQTTFGRDPAAAHVFVDSDRPRMISRIHATITVTRPDASPVPVYTITAQGMNGVTVNGVARTEWVLQEGDIIVFGGAGANNKPGTRVSKALSELAYQFTRNPHEVSPPPPSAPSESVPRTTATAPTTTATASTLTLQQNENASMTTSAGCNENQADSSAPASGPAHGAAKAPGQVSAVHFPRSLPVSTEHQSTTSAIAEHERKRDHQPLIETTDNRTSAASQADTTTATSSSLPSQQAIGAGTTTPSATTTTTTHADEITSTPPTQDTPRSQCSCIPGLCTCTTTTPRAPRSTPAPVPSGAPAPTSATPTARARPTTASTIASTTPPPPIEASRTAAVSVPLPATEPRPLPPATALLTDDVDLTASPIKRKATQKNDQGNRNDDEDIDDKHDNQDGSQQTPEIATSKRRKTALVRVESSEMVTSTQLQQEVASAKKKMFDDLEEELTCCICRELILLAHLTPCQHAFCKECIFDWINRNAPSATCPQCRMPITSPPQSVKILDNAIDKVAAMLPADEIEDRKRRAEAAKNLVLTFTRKVVKQARVTAPPLPFQHAVFNTTPAAANTTNRSHPITTRAAATTTTAALDVEEDGYRGYEPSVFTPEYARSGRSLCRTCMTYIPQGALRWKEEYTEEYEYYRSTRYHHYVCPTAHFSLARSNLTRKNFTTEDWTRLQRDHP